MSTESQNLDRSLPLNTARALAIWEIASVVTSCLIAEWAVLSFVARGKLITALPILLAGGLMMFSHYERGESLWDIGFRSDNVFAGCRLLLLPTIAAIFLILVAAWFSGYPIPAAPLRSRFLLLPLWALFQQYALNGFINRRAQIAFGKGLKSIVIVAVIFGLLHLPHPLLAVITLLGGLVWAAVYQRQPNLFALALSHTVASLSLALAIPPGFLNGLRVGFKYFG